MLRRLIISALLLAPLYASAQNLQWVGIDSRVGNLMAHRQDSDEFCWAASAQMILNYYGVSVTQETIAKKIHGTADNIPGSDEDISAALTGWRVSGSQDKTRSTQGRGLPTPQVLVSELSAGRPLLITFSTGPNTGHAVVITAAGFLRTANGINVRSLVIRDPWPSRENVATSGRVQYDNLNLALFAQNVSNHWLVFISTSSDDGSIDLSREPKTGSRSESRNANACEEKHDSCMENVETQDACVNAWFEGCMKSCQNDYGNFYAACRSNFCSASNGPNREWASNCRTSIRIATQRCDNRQRTCERQ